MKKRLAILFLPIALSLVSCGETKSKEDAPLIEMSGAFAYTSSEIESYADIKTNRDAASLIAEAEQDMPVFVLFARESCSHCTAFEPYFIKAMKKIQRNVYVYYYGDTDSDEDIDDRAFVAEALRTFQEKYGKVRGEGGIDGAVPTLYRLDATKANLMDMYNDNGSSAKFASYMQYETKETDFYRFSDFESFNKAISDKPSVRRCLYDSNDASSQVEYVKEFNNSYDTKTFVLDYATLTPNEKSEALTSFGLSTYQFTLN